MSVLGLGSVRARGRLSWSLQVVPLGEWEELSNEDSVGASRAYNHMA